MGRPSNFNREEALEQAMLEFWRNGYQACSLKALSEKLGVTRSSLYNAFGSREKLFWEAASIYAQRTPEHRLADQDWKGRIVDLLTNTIHEICRVRAADPAGKGCMMTNSIAELVSTDEGPGRQLAQAVGGSIDQFERLLRLAVENGELPTDINARSKALAIQNLVFGINIMSKAERSEEDLWAAASETLKGLGLYTEKTNS